MSAELPHSRACGFRRHDHGPECHTNCPTCHGRALPDTPTAPEPAAAPQVDTDFARRLADDGLEPFDLRSCIRRLADELDTLREAGKVVVADADAAWAEVARQRTELDTHRARHAELVALVAEWRASGEAATENPGLRAVMLARAVELARIIGEQP